MNIIDCRKALPSMLRLVAVAAMVMGTVSGAVSIAHAADVVASISPSLAGSGLKRPEVPRSVSGGPTESSPQSGAPLGYLGSFGSGSGLDALGRPANLSEKDMPGAPCHLDVTVTAPSVYQALSSGWDLRNYDKLCAQLEQAGAGLYISGRSAVIGRNAVAWASVAVKDKHLHIMVGDFGGVSTNASEEATQEAADRLLATSVNAAINNTKVEQALELLDRARDGIAQHGALRRGRTNGEGAGFGGGAGAAGGDAADQKRKTGD